jgi:hypothetical protein
MVGAFLNPHGGSADPIDERAYFVPACVARVVGFDFEFVFSVIARVCMCVCTRACVRLYKAYACVQTSV